ncbi:MAG TPA: hypothetical protein VM052_09235 [Candidatus Limnocylindrales bacterium]|nr:hypothetical protein [Candidatus Limnocylindrales bacterium]
MRWVGALLPLAMTFAIVAAALQHAIAVGGFVREPDEGTAAHLFQIFLPAQIPIIVLFGATQMERYPTFTRRFLAAQIGAAGLLVATVFIFNW